MFRYSKLKWPITTALLVALPELAYAAKLEGVVFEAAAAVVVVASFPFYLVAKYSYKKIRHASHEYRVWFGTNRRFNILKGTFSEDFTEQLSYGTCTVSVPKGHKFGSIGSPWPIRFLQRITAGTDDKLTLTNLLRLDVDGFEESLKKCISEFKERRQTSALVYIHGFNVNFESAAIRAAQIGYDLQVPGPMAFFSWPSKGRADPIAYAADKETIAATEQILADFLVNFSRIVGDMPISVLAHSMGNVGLLRTLHSATVRAAQAAGLKFNQVFLAAPDVDQRLFKQLSNIYPRISQRTTLYISSLDAALEASRKFSETDRVGYAPPITVVDGIDTIEVTNIDIDLLGHGYFAAASGVLYDMAQLLRSDSHPNARPRLELLQASTGQYWSFRP